MRDGLVDAGTVRTDTLERMVGEGKINLSDFKILNSQASDPSFPFLRSTRLYPEWPWARLRHTPDDLAEKVTIALLSMTPEDPAARAANIAGWTVPLDYQPVHELMREVKIGPYEDLGQVTLREVVRAYFAYLTAGAGLFFFMIMVTGWMTKMNRKLEKTKSELDQELENRKAAEEALNKAYDELKTGSSAARSSYRMPTPFWWRKTWNGKRSRKSCGVKRILTKTSWKPPRCSF